MFGCPKLEVHWHWPQEDINQTLRAQTLIAGELERAGLGTLKLVHDPEGLPNIDRPVGSHYLMGTTRMHDNPKQGVVDANCRVHGIHNLFVAGSSTFPTGGYANPTLTIVAMALRLGDLLKQELAAEALASTLFYPAIGVPEISQATIAIAALPKVPSEGM
jgi:choline dehydrogenase-like flavoprotein